MSGKVLTWKTDTEKMEKLNRFWQCKKYFRFSQLSNFCPQFLWYFSVDLFRINELKIVVVVVDVDDTAVGLTA